MGHGDLETRYAVASDGAHLAYQVSGEGPLDLLVAFGQMISVEDQAAGKECRDLIDRLSAFARVIRFDRRGSGLSDPVSTIDEHTWEQWADDAFTVLDAVGTNEVCLFSADMTTTLFTLMMAATHPNRVGRIALFNPSVRWLVDDDYPMGMDPEMGDRIVDAAVASLVDPDYPFLPLTGTDDTFRQWWTAARRRGASPGETRALYANGLQTDMRSVLPAVHTPTLVLLRPGGPPESVARVHYVAEHLPDATVVELPDHPTSLSFLGDRARVAAEVEQHLTGARRATPTERVLATVLFTDIVDSTQRLSSLGDQAWKAQLDAHDAVVRAQLATHRGREVKNLGDGFLATFDGPAAAIRCALAIRDAAGGLGIEVRAGIHTGEVERRGDDIAGVAVHLGARVMGEAGDGEIYVSRTVTDLVAGAGFAFEARGEHELKGIDGTWALFAVSDPA